MVLQRSLFRVSPDGHPGPCLCHDHAADGPLHSVESHLLLGELLERLPGLLAPGAGLHPGEDRADPLLSLLLHPSVDSGSEEDLGVAKTELVLVQANGLHDSGASRLVVLGLGHRLGCQDVEPGLELGVEGLVGETSTADGNSSEYTVALVLMHDECRLDATRDLVGVGHHATDEGGLGLVENSHEVVQLALEVGGHGLAALALLAVSVLVNLG